MDEERRAAVMGLAEAMKWELSHGANPSVARSVLGAANAFLTRHPAAAAPQQQQQQQPRYYTASGRRVRGRSWEVEEEGDAKAALLKHPSATTHKRPRYSSAAGAGAGAGGGGGGGGSSNTAPHATAPSSPLSALDMLCEAAISSSGSSSSSSGGSSSCTSEGSPRTHHADGGATGAAGDNDNDDDDGDSIDDEHTARLEATLAQMLNSHVELMGTLQSLTAQNVAMRQVEAGLDAQIRAHHS